MWVKKCVGTIVTVCILMSALPIVPVLAAEEVVKVGYYTDYTDIIEDIESLNNKGYGYEVFRKIEEVSDLKFEFVPIEGDMFEAVNSGVVDVGGLNIRSDERREEVLYSANPFSKTSVALMTDDMEMIYADYESMDGKTVATYEGSEGMTDLERFCDARNISVEYVYASLEEYMELDTDFYINMSESRVVEEGNNVLNLGVYNLYLVTSFENQELMDKIDRIFIDVVKTEGNFFLELEEKYLADKLEINHRGLTIAEIETLRERPLEVGYISDYEPISFTNEDGEPDGAMVETLSVLAERYDFQVNYHPYSILDDPNNHEGFDLLVTLYGEGEHEFEYYQPTEAYYLISVYAQVKASVHSSSGSTKETIEASPRIGSLRYQSVEYEVFLDEFPDNEFVFYDDWHQLLDDFADGAVDMMISTDSAARYAELYLEDVDRETISTDLQIPMQYFISHEIADEYIPIFNVMLDRQTEDEYEAVLTTNANAYYPENEMDFLEFMQDRWYMFLGTALVIVATFLGFALYAQKKKKDALKEAYDTDALTDFLAMHRFREIVKEKLSEAKENEYELISFDIDMFKTINTHFSAERGTNVIKAIANSLKTVFEGKTAVICRKTADQFLVFRRVDDGGTLRQIYSSDILPSIQGVMGEKYNVMMSFGNVVIRDCKENPSTIIGQADNARVQGKNEHKTTFITFDEKMQKFYEERVNVTFRMEQALKNREFTVVYQPKIDFKTLEVGGAEALVRWFPKLGNTIFPDQFIPVFEANGFIEFLDLYVLEDVCKFIRSNYRTMSIPRISVNLSANTILADNIVARVTDIVSTYSIRPDEIELEITESAVEGDTEKFMLRVKQLREMGYPIAIDDFGAGVSSLNRLSAIEADVLKLDKAFFDLKDQGGKSAVVVTNVIAMAKELKMKVVAEGVETYAQALWLRKIDCDYAQGYYFERPISENDFRALLESKKVFGIEL